MGVDYLSNPPLLLKPAMITSIVSFVKWLQITGFPTGRKFLENSYVDYNTIRFFPSRRAGPSRENPGPGKMKKNAIFLEPFSDLTNWRFKTQKRSQTMEKQGPLNKSMPRGIAMFPLSSCQTWRRKNSSICIL